MNEPMVWHYILTLGAHGRATATYRGTFETVGPTTQSEVYELVFTRSAEQFAASTGINVEPYTLYWRLEPNALT